MSELAIKIELYGRYVDDIDMIMRSIGWRMKWFPLAGVMVLKSEEQITDKENMSEDELTMIELRKIGDLCV